MSRLMVSLVCLLAGPTGAMAGPMAGFHYRTSIIGDPFVPPAGDPVPGRSTLYAASDTGSAMVTFHGVEAWTAGTWSDAFVAGTLSSFAATAPGAAFAAEFDTTAIDGHYPGSYTLEIGVQDSASATEGVFAFRGLFGGTIALDANGDPVWALTNAPTGATTLEQVIGGTRYRVSLGAFDAPGAPRVVVGGEVVSVEGPPGRMMAAVETLGPVAETPEPGTLLLGLVGLGAAGLRTRIARPALKRRGRVSTVTPSS